MVIFPLATLIPGRSQHKAVNNFEIERRTRNGRQPSCRGHHIVYSDCSTENYIDKIMQAIPLKTGNWLGYKLTRLHFIRFRIIASKMLPLFLN